MYVCMYVCMYVMMMYVSAKIRGLGCLKKTHQGEAHHVPMRVARRHYILHILYIEEKSYVLWFQVLV